MSAEEIARIGEINREESIEGEFVPESDASGFGIVARYREYQQPMIVRAWGEAGSDGRIRKWRPELEAGGTMFGAFKADRFAGFLILGPSKADQSAEVVALFANRDFRQRGVGTKLLQLAENKSILLGLEALFVYSNPTASAANFYLKHGFQITGLISKHIVKALSGDILMAKKLPPSPLGTTSP